MHLTDMQELAHVKVSNLSRQHTESGACFIDPTLVFLRKIMCRLTKS